MVKLKQKLKIFYLLGIIIIVFFASITIFGDEGLLKLRKLYTFKDQVQKENQELYLANQKLAREVNQLKESSNTERLIREKLGYIKSNEYILILGNKSESQPSTGMPSGM